MVSGIKTVARPGKSRARGFLASSGNSKTERNSRKAVKMALATKFNVMP